MKYNISFFDPTTQTNSYISASLNYLLREYCRRATVVAATNYSSAFELQMDADYRFMLVRFNITFCL